MLVLALALGALVSVVLAMRVPIWMTESARVPRPVLVSNRSNTFNLAVAIDQVVHLCASDQIRRWSDPVIVVLWLLGGCHDRTNCRQGSAGQDR